MPAIVSLPDAVLPGVVCQPRLILLAGPNLSASPVVGTSVRLDALVQNPDGASCGRTGKVQFAWSPMNSFGAAMPLGDGVVTGPSGETLAPGEFGAAYGSWRPASASTGFLWASVHSPNLNHCIDKTCAADPIDPNAPYTLSTPVSVASAGAALAARVRQHVTYLAFGASGHGGERRLSIAAMGNPSEDSFTNPEVKVALTDRIGPDPDRVGYHSGQVSPQDFDADLRFEQRINVPNGPVFQAVARIDWGRNGANKRCLIEVSEERTDEYGRRKRTGFHLGLRHLPGAAEDEIWLSCPR